MLGTKIARSLLSLVFIGLSAPESAAAQDTQAQRIRPSQRASVSQHVANTVVSIEYSRPVARGRELFGDGNIVRWGRIWNPGADSASAVTFSTDVQVNGHPLSAGSYTIWTEPQPEQWTVIFSRAYPIWHTPYQEGQDALRLTVTPRAGAHMETLAYYFPVVEGRQAELVMHWGTMVIPLQLEVP